MIKKSKKYKKHNFKNKTKKINGVIFNKITNNYNKKTKNYSKNKIKKDIFLKGGAGFKVTEFTEGLIEQFRICKDFSVSELLTVSIFNPSITWICDYRNIETKKRISYYAMSCRVCWYNNKTENRQLTEQEALQMYDIWNKKMVLFPENIPYIKLSQGFSTKDTFVKRSGSFFNKWYGPFGFWGNNIDDFNSISEVKYEAKQATMITIFKFDAVASKLVAINSKVIDNIIDARILNLWNQKELHNDGFDYIINSLMITGSKHKIPKKPSIKCVKEKEDKEVLVDPDWSNTSVYNGDLVSDCSWKQSSLQFQVIQHDDKNTLDSLKFSFYNPEIEYVLQTEPLYENSLANAISWQHKMEKNYALFYFKSQNSLRSFCPDKCMILNYILDYAKPETDIYNNEGMVFYYKEWDSDTGDDIKTILQGKLLENPEDTNERRTWHMYNPKNSNIFSKLKKHYNEMYGANMHISCTTPFFEEGEYLYAVGHIKLNIFKYMNNLIEYACDQLGIAKATDQEFSTTDVYPTFSKDDMKKIINYWEETNKNNLFISGIDIIYKMRDIIKENTNTVIYNKIWMWKDNKNMKIPEFLKYNTLLKFLISKQAIKPMIPASLFSTQSYKVPFNIHPELIYYMFLYKINKNTLELDSFNNPFIIFKDNSDSFINFPMGITNIRVQTTEADDNYDTEEIIITYGDGDCKCYQIILDKQTFTKKHKNDNNTNVQDIIFNIIEK